MSSNNPKIVVLHLKELIYTIIFIAFAILLIFLLVFMFRSSRKDKETSVPEESTYTAWVYTSAITVNGSAMELQVTLDKDNINAIELKNTDDAVTAMYPLMMSSVENLSNQIVATQSLDNISYTDDCKYTYSALLETIDATLDKAKVNN